MSIPVNYFDQLDGLEEGAKVIVRMVDDGSVTVTWTATGDGSFTDGDAVIPSSGFTAAIERGNVYLPSDYQVGQYIIGLDGYYYRILGREDDQWVSAKTDNGGTVRATVLFKGEPMGTPEEIDDRYIGPACDMVEQLWRAETVQKRLDSILESGEIPADVTYRVSVEVKGSVGVQPSEAQVRRLIGDNHVKVTNVNTTDVAYTKTVVVAKNSRWGCACDQVTAEDLTGAPGEVTSWVVIECVDPEGKSAVHNPLEVGVDEEAEAS